MANIKGVAMALSRRRVNLTKYIGIAIGAHIHVDLKQEKFIVNGAHEAAVLQNILRGFITKYVLCQVRQNPETNGMNRLTICYKSIV